MEVLSDLRRSPERLFEEQVSDETDFDMTVIQVYLDLAENRLKNAKNQYDLILESNKSEEISLKKHQVMKSELEKLEIVNVEKKKVEALVQDEETKNEENLVERNDVSNGYVIPVTKERASLDCTNGLEEKEQIAIKDNTLLVLWKDTKASTSTEQLTQFASPVQYGNAGFGSDTQDLKINIVEQQDSQEILTSQHSQDWYLTVDKTETLEIDAKNLFLTESSLKVQIVKLEKYNESLSQKFYLTETNLQDLMLRISKLDTKDEQLQEQMQPKLEVLQEEFFKHWQLVDALEKQAVQLFVSLEEAKNVCEMVKEFVKKVVERKNDSKRFLFPAQTEHDSKFELHKSEINHHSHNNLYQAFRFSDLLLDVRMKILTKALQTDPERVARDFALVSKSWNKLVKSKEFANQYNHEDCPKGRRHIILQTSRLDEDGSMCEGTMWDLILEEGRATILVRRCPLPIGRKMIGADGTSVAFGSTSRDDLLLIRDWIAWDLHPVGMTRCPSNCLSYGYSRILRVFDEENGMFYELKNGSEHEDGAWSPAWFMNMEIGDIGHPCSTTEYFCFLLPSKKGLIMIRIKRLSGQLFEDDTPRCAFECSLHVFERRNVIHLCRLSTCNGVETFIWNDETRSWLVFAHYFMTIRDPSVNWRVFGVGEDWILISCCNIIDVINVATSTLIDSRIVPVAGLSNIIANYINGCRCADGLEAHITITKQAAVAKKKRKEIE